MNKFILWLLILLVPTIASGAVTFDLRNNTDLKAIVWVYWVDHSFRDTYPAPMNLACAELEPRSNWEIGTEYQEGQYIIVWQPIEVGKEYHKVKFYKYISSMKTVSALLPEHIKEK